MTDGGVAVQHLENEQLHGVGRVQHAIAPDMAHRREAIVDALGAAEVLQRIGFDLTKNRRDDGHPWPPLSLGDVRNPHPLRSLRYAPAFVTRAIARTYELNE